MRPGDALVVVVAACLLASACSRLTFIKPKLKRRPLSMPPKPTRHKHTPPSHPKSATLHNPIPKQRKCTTTPSCTHPPKAIKALRHPIPHNQPPTRKAP